MDNKREPNTKSDKYIMRSIAKAVNRTIVMMAEDMGEKKNTLYQVTTGRNNISPRIMSKILETYPTVNPKFLETGEGKPLIPRKVPSVDASFQDEIFMQLALLNKKIELISQKLDNLNKK